LLKVIGILCKVRSVVIGDGRVDDVPDSFHLACRILEKIHTIDPGSKGNAGRIIRDSFKPFYRICFNQNIVIIVTPDQLFSIPFFFIVERWRHCEEAECLERKGCWKRMPYTFPCITHKERKILSCE